MGCLRYLASALRSDIDADVSIVSTMMTSPTTAVMAAADRIFAYLKGCPNLGITYKASDMILKAYTDASFDSEHGHKSRSGGYFYLGNKDDDGFINGAIAITSRKQQSVVVSATEAEYVALFDVALSTVYFRKLLRIFGHDQPPTTISCDNTVAVGLANGKVSDGRTKHVDRKFHWTREQVAAGVLRVIWQAGKDNLADFFTKFVDDKTHERFTGMMLTKISSTPIPKSERLEPRGCVN